jgi:hypothetical protein
MRIGMQWFVDVKRNVLDDDVREAAAFYTKKYGRKPDTCYTHPDAIPAMRVVDGINVVPVKGTLKNWLWIGVNDDE